MTLGISRNEKELLAFQSILDQLLLALVCDSLIVLLTLVPQPFAHGREAEISFKCQTIHFLLRPVRWLAFKKATQKNFLSLSFCFELARQFFFSLNISSFYIVKRIQTICVRLTFIRNLIFGLEFERHFIWVKRTKEVLRGILKFCLVSLRFELAFLAVCSRVLLKLFFRLAALWDYSRQTVRLLSVLAVKCAFLI